MNCCGGLNKLRKVKVAEVAGCGVGGGSKTRQVGKVRGERLKKSV